MREDFESDRQISAETRVEKQDSAQPFSFFDALRQGRIADVAEFFRRSLSPSKEQSNQKVPNVEIDIHFGSHATEQDVKNWQNKIKDADVVIHELLGYSDRDMRILQGLSDGRIKPDDLIYNNPEDESAGKYDEYANALSRIIYKSGKKIVGIDIPDGHPILKRIDRSMENIEILYSLLFSIPYQKYAMKFKKLMREQGDIQRQREEYIVRRFRKAVEPYIQQQQGGKPVRIFMFFGVVHTWVYHRFKRLGFSVQRSMEGRTDYLYGNLTNELERKARFNVKITKRDMTRKVFFDILRAVYIEILDHFGFALARYVDIFVRLAAEKFSDTEIENLYNEIRSEVLLLGIHNVSDVYSDKIFFSRAREIIDHALAAKGASFPTSQSELLRQTEGIGVKMPLP